MLTILGSILNMVEKGGEGSVDHVKCTKIFHLLENKIFIWTPKIMGLSTRCMIWNCRSSCTNYMFQIYEKWVHWEKYPSLTLYTFTCYPNTIFFCLMPMFLLPSLLVSFEVFSRLRGSDNNPPNLAWNGHQCIPLVDCISKWLYVRHSRSFFWRFKN